MSGNNKRTSTVIVDGGRREWRDRLVNVPVHRASTILFDSVAELREQRARSWDLRYGLQGTPTHWALSEALTELEPGAAGTALYSTGLAAITWLSCCGFGRRRLLVPDSVYGPTRKFCDGSSSVLEWRRAITIRWSVRTLPD